MTTKKRNPHPLSVARLLMAEYQICQTLANNGGKLRRLALAEALPNINAAHINLSLSSLVKKGLIRQVEPRVFVLTWEGWRFLGSSPGRWKACA